MLQEMSDECYAFASFRLYPRQRTILQDTELVAIGGRAFDMLLLLVSRAGSVVSQREVMKFVWPNVTVDEANLRVQMGMVRKILARCQEAKRAIETVPLRGYCFILPVQHSRGSIHSESRAPEYCAPLPTLLNPIIGREEAIVSVANALDERRLVTVAGPGGIGKTTVAIATASRYQNISDRMVAFVDLSQVREGANAALAIAAAVGVRAQGDALIAVCEYLHDREFLLILDTCEHIVEATALLVEILLNHCPNLRLLVTSREALRATGEWVHRLSSLTFPEKDEVIDEGNAERFTAVSFFVDRVKSCMHFEVSRPDLQILADICRGLDGIPLALEFAAERVADLGLRGIAARIDDCFAILTRGRRTALPRHRTLSAALDWSYSLLSKDEQRMLRHLSTLGRCFAAEHAIVGGGPEAFAGLFEKSLISVDIKNDAPIYRLFDTTKAYVARMHGD